MGYDKRLFELVKHPLRVRRLSVVSSRAVTPRMRRIRLGGSDLEGFSSLAPEDHVKLFFPAPGETEPALPSFGPLGMVANLANRSSLIGRDYTPYAYDAAARELEIDFYLHGHGVASTWAARAQPGDRIGVVGPRGSFVEKRPFEWQLLVGDETALPEMSLRLSRLPAGSRALACFLVDDAREEQALSSPGQLEVHWLHRQPGQPDSSPRLVEAVRALSLPSTPGYCWIAGELAEVRSVYRYLVAERGIAAELVHASGHWKRGVVNHDHHEEITI